MAPPAGELLNYIYGKESLGSLPLLLSNAALLSILLLLFCSFYKKVKKVEHFEKDGSVLTKVTVKGSIPSERMKRTQNEVDKDANERTPKKRENIPRNKSPDLKDRALPLPPQTDVTGQPGGHNAEEPLYDTLNKEPSGDEGTSVSQLTQPEPHHNNVLPVEEEEDDKDLKSEELKPAKKVPLYSVVHKKKTAKTKEGGSDPSAEHTFYKGEVTVQRDDDQLGRSGATDPTQVQSRPPVSDRVRQTEDPSLAVDKVSLMYNKAKKRTFSVHFSQSSSRSATSEEPPPLPEKKFDPEEEL